MKWSQTPPTELGWHWLKLGPGIYPLMVCATHEGTVKVGGETWPVENVLRNHPGAVWYGPLLPPDTPFLPTPEPTRAT